MKTEQFNPKISTFIAMALFLAIFTVPMNIQAAVYEGVEDPNLKEEDCASEVLLTTAQTSVLGIGGPDAGGYYYYDNQQPGGPAFDWFEISGTGTNLNLGDDTYYYPINVPFSFDFYGTNYSQIAVGSNGGVYFERRYLTFGNRCIPGNFEIDRFIAMYWDDLYPSRGGPDNVYYKIVGNTPNRKLIVQWQNVRHFGSTSSRVTAQAQLSENGDILLLYADPSSEAGQFGTVGIQNDPTTGLQYLCNERGLSAGLAVLFTRNLGCNEPQAPEEPQPENGATDVPINTQLVWNGGNGGGGNCDESCGVENGSFETGEFTPWIAVTGPGEELTSWNIGTGDRGWFENGFPFEGNLCAQNGFDGSAGLYYDLYQETAIPDCASSAILTWSERIQWNMVDWGATLPREYIVSVQPVGGGAPLAIVYSMQLQPGTQGDTGYVTHSFDLLDLAPSIAGQTIRINFHEYVPQNMTGPAQFDLDGISLVCGGQVQLSNLNPLQSEAATVDFEALVANYEQIRQHALDVAASNDIICSPPEGMSYREGILVEGINEEEIPSTAPEATVQTQLIPGATLIDFDNVDAPCVFRDTIRLSNEYAALGVTFEGQGGNDGGAILNECGGFSVSGHSSPNFLAFNTGSSLNNGGIPRGPETIHFTPPVSHVELRAGYAGSSITMEAYDVNGSVVDTSTILLTQTMSPISVSGNTITRVVISSRGGVFVLDDLQFITEEGPPPPPVSPITYDIFLGTDESQMELVGSDLEEPVFNPCILDYETTYYWQVIAKDDCGQTAGPIWSFTTEAWQPLPEDGAIGVPIDSLLEWNGPSGDGNGGNCDESCGVENGGFETDQFAPWVAVTGQGSELRPWSTSGTGYFGNGFPFEGNSHAQNGFDGSAGLYYDLYQETAIPACAASAILTWSDRIQWLIRGQLPREYIVSVQPAGGGAPLAIAYSTQLQPGTQGDTGYVTHSVDLLDLAPSIAGQTVRVNFHQYIPESYTGPAQFDLDGISLVCGGQVQLSNLNPLQSETTTVDFEAFRAEYDSIREAADLNQTQEASQDSVDASQGGTDVTPSKNLVNALITTDTQQVIDASDRGWWKNNGSHSASNKNTITGQDGSGTDLYNSFFVFDLMSVLPGSFASATLRLEIENYYGPDASESLTIYDVSTPVSVLTSSGTNVGVFNDLGSGNSYGNFTVLRTDEGNILEITLNSQALADIAAATGGYFAVGLHVNDIGLRSGDEGVRFSESDEARVHQLVLTTTGDEGNGGGEYPPVTYDVFLGTDEFQVELVGSDLEEPVLNPCILDYETTYYWQVIAKTDCGQTTSPVWSFTTEAWQPLPEDGAIDVPIDTLLNWNGPVGGGNCDETCGVENGGFETGQFTPWFAVTGQGRELDPWQIVNWLPSEGNFHAFNGFDGDAGLYYDLYQETDIPACAPSAILTWSEYLWWDIGGNLPREYTVSVQPAGGGAPIAVVHSMLLNPGTQGDTGYVTHSVDLLELAPSLAGQTVRINFHEYIPETFTGPAAFLLDGISLVCGGEVLINTPQSIADAPSLSQSDLEALSANYEQARQQALDAAQQIRNECVWPSANATENATLQEPMQTVATAPPDGQIINGDFETGTFNGWTLLNIVDSPQYLGTFVINGGSFLPSGPDEPLPPYSGNYSAMSDMQGRGFYTIYQDVALPADTASLTLQWADMIRNHNEIFEDPGQEFRVEVWSLNNQPLATLFSTNPGDPLMTAWTERSADLASFAGQTVRIAFTVDVQLYYFNVHLDNIRINTGSTPPPPTTLISYDVYFGLNPNEPSTWNLIGEGLNMSECDPTPELDGLLRKGRVYYWQVIAKDTCGEVFSPLWSFTTENTPPVADAGDDQTVFCWIDGLVNVTLDGSGSYDEDENPITYLWTWTIDSQTFTATGIAPTITLPAGVHAITLVVNDSIDDSQPDEVVITAEAPVVIPVNCTPKSLNCESRGNWIKAHFVLPPEYEIGDVNTSVPCTLEPLALPTSRINPFINEDGLVQVDVSFDRDELCETDPPLGFNQMMPTGSLISGHYFYGIDEIRILDNRMEHLINLGMNWLAADCIDPNWCNGMDINTDGVVDLRDFAFIE